MTEELQLLVNALVVVASQYAGYKALETKLVQHLKADDKKHAELDERLKTLEDAHGGVLR